MEEVTTNHLSLLVFTDPPSGTQDQAKQICTEVRNHANAPFWLTGDFNLPDISWKHNISGNQNALGVNNAFLTLVEDIDLQQMVDFPTRNNANTGLVLDKPTFTHQPPETNPRNK